MAIIPTHSAAARRNLVQRIERFLDTVDEASRRLDARETELMGRVVAELEAGNFRTGEDVMLQVEQPEIYRSPKPFTSVAHEPTLTTDDVRGIIAKVLQT